MAENGAVEIAVILPMIGPSCRSAFRCRSMGRGPSSQPPGKDRRALPIREATAPKKHNGGTHLPHETVGNVAARDTARIDDQGVPSLWARQPR